MIVSSGSFSYKKKENTAQICAYRDAAKLAPEHAKLPYIHALTALHTASDAKEANQCEWKEYNDNEGAETVMLYTSPAPTSAVLTVKADR